MTTRDNLMVTGASGTPPTPPAVADIYKTQLYTGVAGSQTITTGIDMTTAGGMVYCRALSGSGYGNQRMFWQPQYGLDPYFETGVEPYGNMGTFTSTGFNLVYDWTGLDSGNQDGAGYVSWSFKRAAKFFDYVTWTGDGTSNRVIPHNLGQSPGMAILSTTTSGEYSRWNVRNVGIESSTYNAPNYYSSSFASAYVTFSRNDVFAVESMTNWTTGVQLSADPSNCNVTGIDYIMFLFGDDSSAGGCIRCGMYTGNGSTTGPSVNLGWEPQWLLIKGGSGFGYNWLIYDTARGIAIGDSFALEVNTATSFEVDYGNIATSSTGFQILSDDTQLNDSGTDYVYMAIRKP